MNLPSWRISHLLDQLLVPLTSTNLISHVVVLASFTSIERLILDVIRTLLYNCIESACVVRGEVCENVLILLHSLLLGFNFTSVNAHLTISHSPLLECSLLFLIVAFRSLLAHSFFLNDPTFVHFLALCICDNHVLVLFMAVENVQIVLRVLASDGQGLLTTLSILLL